MNQITSTLDGLPWIKGLRGVGPSDRRLLQEARRGSQEATDELVDRHWARAHRIAYGILGDSHAAEDVAQEAMLSLISSMGRFDLRRPFAPWLHTIVSRKALDWARARERRRETAVSPVGPEDVDSLSGIDRSRHEVSAFDAGLWSGLDPELEAALAELTPEHRAVVVLRFVADYGPKETAELLGIPTGTVGSRLRRALDQLRASLEAVDG